MDHVKAVASEVAAGSLVSNVIIGLVYGFPISPGRSIVEAVSFDIWLKIEKVRALIMPGVVHLELGIVQSDKDRVAGLYVAMDIVMTFVAAGVCPADEVEEVKVSTKGPLSIDISSVSPIEICEPFLRGDLGLRSPVGRDKGRLAVTVKAEGKVLWIVLTLLRPGRFLIGRPDVRIVVGS